MFSSAHSLTRRALLATATAATAAGTFLMRSAQAQDAVPGPLRLLVGFPPGGATDVMARLIAREMAGYSAVIVDNRPGAGSRIAVEAAARAKPDGLTAVVTPDFTLTLMPHLYRKLGYDPLKDLLPVAMCATSETALAVGPAVPAEVTNVATFLKWARSHPQQALYASPSAGSTPHFTGILFARAAKTELTHVSYKGGAQALQDLLGGQVPASFNPVGELLPQLGSSKLRILATSGAKRSPFLPGVPTFSESGYSDVVVQSWLGVVVPKGTPEGVIATMEHSIHEALLSKTVSDGFAKFGLTVAKPVPRDRMAAILREDLQRWSVVVKASGFVMEE